MSGVARKLMSASGKSLEIGDFYEGGFYAGNIFQGGDEYQLIVAPKATGESTSTQYKTSQTASPTATITLNNGPAATAAMVAAGSHPAAAFCDGLTINGFSDWYLPARDELEVAYRNLKPTTQNNSTAFRVVSEVRTYPEGNDVAGDRDGRNRNSSPEGSQYAPQNPSQTEVTLFQNGGSESFDIVAYWTSTEFNNFESWRQEFAAGLQSAAIKTGSFGPRARAFRRVLA